LQEAGESLSLFAKDFDIAHLENLREFNFIDNFYHWFETLNPNEIKKGKEVLEDIGNCLKKEYEKAEREKRIDAQSELTVGMVSEFVDKCFGKGILREMLETLNMHELE
jgi:hypothetical protein